MKFLLLTSFFLVVIEGGPVVPEPPASPNLRLVTLPENITETYMDAETAEFTGPETRIAGGSLARRGQFPWMVRLWQFSGGNSWIVCGATLIDKQWILTAAHCVHKGQNRFMIILGAVNSNNPKESGYLKLTTNTRAIEHPNYNFPRNDIAVLKLPRAVRFTSTIKPISLPYRSQQKETFAGRTATAVGWGLDNDGNNANNDYLKYAQVKVISNQECLQKGWSMPDSGLCTLGNNVRGICSGDSGGPVVVNYGGRTVQVGISSFNDGQCPSRKPNGFARVSSYLDWIAKTTRVHIP